MNLLLLISRALEVFGICLALLPILNYIRDRAYYNEYSANIDTLIEEMRKDGFTVQEDKERLIMAMEEQIKFSKMGAILGVIGVVIMIVFLIKTF
jgi:hypothetical protein